MALKWDSRKKIAKAIDSRTNFKHASMSGKWVTEPLSAWEAGQLPQNFRDQLNADIDQADTYVVFSYNTPIGWNNGTESKYSWTVPTVSYSMTTTHHQGVLMMSQLETTNPYLLD